jgi:hypothetical protein
MALLAGGSQIRRYFREVDRSIGWQCRVMWSVLRSRGFDRRRSGILGIAQQL